MDLVCCIAHSVRSGRSPAVVGVSKNGNGVIDGKGTIRIFHRSGIEVPSNLMDNEKASERDMSRPENKGKDDEKK